MIELAKPYEDTEPVYVCVYVNETASWLDLEGEVTKCVYEYNQDTTSNHVAALVTYNMLKYFNNK